MRPCADGSSIPRRVRVSRDTLHSAFLDRAVTRLRAVGGYGRRLEENEVPAGKFRAIRVERNSTLDEVTQGSTYWYAPRMGCVKWWTGNTECVLVCPGQS